MNPKATTIEQSRKLLELGLDPKSADFAWVGEDGCFVNTSSCELKDTETPAWSLEALIDALPSGTVFISTGRLGYCVSFCAGRGCITKAQNTQKVYSIRCLKLSYGCLKMAICENKEDKSNEKERLHIQRNHQRWPFNARSWRKRHKQAHHEIPMGWGDNGSQKAIPFPLNELRQREMVVKHND